MSDNPVLTRIRAALAIDPRQEAERAETVAHRLGHPPAHLRPAFARCEGEAREARLRVCFEAQGVELVPIPTRRALPAAVTALTATLAPTARLVIGDDERLTALDWSGKSAPQPWSREDTLGDGTAALTHAVAAVAETGTLVLTSRPASPALLAFLPELHIVALDRATIVPAFEDAFARLTERIAGARWPRAVNLVSGASRTGDIGGRIVKGAHGPRRLAVVLYGE